MTENKASAFVKIIKEICTEDGIELTFFSDSWVMELRKGEQRGHIFGYQFGINKAVSMAICNDKSTAYEILKHAGVPAVEHICFMTPAQMKYVGANGCFVELTHLLEQYEQLVIKDNEGTGGMEVYLVRNRVELENVVVNLFPKVRSIAVAPYVDIKAEYRVVMLEGKAVMVFSKERQSVTGDGSHTVAELLLQGVQAGSIDPAGITLTSELANRILPKGESVALTWKHNLGQGAHAAYVEDSILLEQLEQIAKSAMEALGVEFASVDVIMDGADWSLKVLEVNSGVMMENLAKTDENRYEQVKAIYRRAIEIMLKA